MVTININRTYTKRTQLSFESLKSQRIVILPIAKGKPIITVGQRVPVGKDKGPVRIEHAIEGIQLRV